jgi:hypothetical protein
MDSYKEIRELTENLLKEVPQHSTPFPNMLFKEALGDEYTFGFAMEGIFRAWDNIAKNGSLSWWEFSMSGYRGKEKSYIPYKDLLESIKYWKSKEFLKVSKIEKNKIYYKWDPIKLYKGFCHE